MKTCVREESSFNLSRRSALAARCSCSGIILFNRFIFTALLILWLATAPPTQTHQAGTQPKSPHAAPAPSGAWVGHIVIVIGENANASDAERGCQWLDALGAKYATASRYYADTHPSIGNYFVMTTGQVLTNDDEHTPLTSPVSVDNVVRQLLAAGKTWKAYAEDVPSVGYVGGDRGKFATRHVPLPYLIDVQNSATQRQNIVPFTQFALDLTSNNLPNYSFVTPNVCNDAHDCPIAAFDNWLRLNIGPLLTSSQFLHDGLLVVTWDESGNDNANGGGRVQFVLAGPTVKPAYQSTTLYRHESLCRMSLEGLGVTTLPTACASAPAMSEFFTTAAPPAQPARQNGRTGRQLPR
jgi:phosphatidylinositol-3-phosphatase